MNKRVALISLIVAALSALGGFLLANAFNRASLDELRGENERLRAAAEGTSKSEGEFTLSEVEIRRKVEEADAIPGDFTFQKNLGTALYRYGSLRQDAGVIQEAQRLLERAAKLNSGDASVQLALGNSYFDRGYIERQNTFFERAREIYRSILANDPQNAAVRTDLGLTYFLQDPPDLNNAAEHLETALAIDSKNERNLQFMVQVYWRLKQPEKAAERLERLKQVSPDSPAINELATLLTTDPNASAQ
ncbi:MAG: tetratricopeptide repeat protein [Blastocatellia bacterium]|nr:tetratricopeptide repeat protein [Blastocatellia bacterium]